MVSSIQKWDARKTNRVIGMLENNVSKDHIVHEFGITLVQVNACQSILNGQRIKAQAPKIKHIPKTKWDEWTADWRTQFIKDAGNGMHHKDLAVKFNISVTTVREYKAKFKIYVKRRGLVFAPSEMRQTSKPEGDTSQRKPRKCLAWDCGEMFDSHDPGNRICPSCSQLKAFKGSDNQMVNG